MQNRYVVIMAGGVGSRFWPSSTETRPKQFIDILGIGKSLLRMTYERCLQLVDSDRIIIVTNKIYKDIVIEELPELKVSNILCEPARNNTAPCIAYAALHINAIEKNATFAVLPSDHVILFEDEFVAAMNHAFDYAVTEDAILTLGIEPTRPDTGYGYIEMAEEISNGIKKVTSFKEKPSRDIATQYVEAGNYVWNAGIFIWSIDTLLRAFTLHAPFILNTLTQSIDKYNTKDEQAYIDEVYPLTQKISIDFAILEKANNVYTLPANIGWSDLGTWNSLHSYSHKDENNNVIQGSNIVLDDVSNCIIKIKDGKKLLLKDIKDYIIIDEEDALLIYPIDKEQEIKESLKKFT
jgi:mannose-1-phosphate guanylyltransferase